MSKKSLPVYQIPDFESDHLDSSAFYYSRLGRHLKKHKFIQKPHKHDFFLLLLITAGKGTHSIDFRNYEVVPGAAFFLRPGQVHSWQLSQDTEGHILFFSSAFYSESLPASNLSRFPFFNSSHHPCHLILDSEMCREIDFLFSELEKETSSARWSQKEMLRSYLEVLLIKFSRVYQNIYGLREAQFPLEDQFHRLEEIMESEFHMHRDASFYAEKMNLSLKQINRMTKTATGKTISQLLLDRVVLESQRLLTYSTKGVSEIAALLGFDDPSYFTRLFRKKTGLTPENFRKSVH